MRAEVRSKALAGDLEVLNGEQDGLKPFRACWSWASSETRHRKSDHRKFELPTPGQPTLGVPTRHANTKPTRRESRCRT